MTKFEQRVNKVCVFVWKHKFAFGLGAGMLGAYCCGRGRQKDIYRKQNEAIEKEREQQQWLEERRKAQEAYENDPKNRLGDAGILDWEESYCDPECTSAIVNAYKVPLDKMGEFGEELRKRLAENEETRPIAENPGTCYVTVTIDENTEEEPEEESQEKQAL